MSLLLVLAAAGFAADTRPEAPKAAIPPEIQAHVPSDLRSYFIGFLINPPEPKPFPFELFAKHQAYIREHIEKGDFKLVGPLHDDPKIRGMKILVARDLAHAKQLVEGDPAVQAGVFATEVRAATFPNLDGLTISYSPSKPE